MKIWLIYKVGMEFWINSHALYTKKENVITISSGGCLNPHAPVYNLTVNKASCTAYLVILL